MKLVNILTCSENFMENIETKTKRQKVKVKNTITDTYEERKGKADKRGVR